jgi:hypothetical protein
MFVNQLINNNNKDIFVWKYIIRKSFILFRNVIKEKM